MLEGMGLVLVEWRQMDLEQGVKSGLCAQQNQELLGHCHYHYPILSEIMRLKKKGASNFLSLTCRQYGDRLLPAELTPPSVFLKTTERWCMLRSDKNWIRL
jgi:hypothetical protein